jgi:sortase A
MARLMKWLIWGLFALAIYFLASAFYIPAKAVFAQYLLDKTWQQTLIDKQVYKPWPWADTYPVARLLVPELNVEQIVLDGEQGNSLAFAPGLHPDSELGKHSGMMVISAHRDTHFRFLEDVKTGEVIEIQSRDGSISRFQVKDVQVVNIRHTVLNSPTDGKWLALVTCYPFHSIEADPDLRYVVLAEQVRDSRCS